MSDSSHSVVVAALTVSLVLILTLITVIVTLSFWLLKLRRRLYKESQVNSDVVPSQNKGQHDEICGDVVKYEVGVVILPSKVQKVQRCVEPPSDDFTICSTPSKV